MWLKVILPEGVRGLDKAVTEKLVCIALDGNLKGSQSKVCTIEQPSSPGSRQPDLSWLKKRADARVRSTGW